MSQDQTLHRGESKTTKDKIGVRPERNFNHLVTEYSGKSRGSSCDPYIEPEDVK
jgi:hypothetical protein